MYTHFSFVTTFLDIDLSRFVLQIFGARQHEPYLSCRFLFKVSIYPFVLFQFSLSFYLSSINRFNFYSRSILIKVIAGGGITDAIRSSSDNEWRRSFFLKFGGKILGFHSMYPSPRKYSPN